MDGDTAMTLSYFRSGGGRAAVPEGEWFEVQGTSFKAWRQVATPAVGWFGGELTEDESNRLDAAIRGCLAAEPAESTVARPGAAIVHIALDDTSVSFGSGSAPQGPWSHLDEVCRELCDAIVDRPTAAIGIELAPGEALLSHRGSGRIDVDLDGASFVAIAWKGWYEEAGRREGPLDGTPGEVGPGWTRSIPIGEFDGGADVTVHVTVELTIGSGRDATRVAVSHAPDLSRPG